MDRFKPFALNGHMEEGDPGMEHTEWKYHTCFELAFLVIISRFDYSIFKQWMDL